MQYSQMTDLIEKARQRGAEEEYTNSVLREQFELWLSEQRVAAEVSDEEEEVLWLAFQEGFGIK